MLECCYCEELVLGKSLFAHIVLRHQAIPTPSDVPMELFPRTEGVRRLHPQIKRIVGDWVAECRSRVNENKRELQTESAASATAAEKGESPPNHL